MARIILFFFCVFFSVSTSAQSEVMYEIFTRSFFDGDGDSNGDLKGIREKLDYLQKFGVNAIVLSPIYQSEYYHNKYATNMEAIDKEYGTMQEYKALIEEVHKRKMKIYQEFEMQYLPAEHPWFASSNGEVDSESMGMLHSDYTTYNNVKGKIVALNMKNPKVREYTLKVLKDWMDPDADGKFDDGIDGFKLSAVSDNPPGGDKSANLLKDFWSPVMSGLKTLNPQVKIMAEPYDTNADVIKYLTVTKADRVYANALREAIVAFDKKKITAAAQAAFFNVPEGRQPIVFIEGPETDRFASGSDMNIGKLRVSAALNLLMGGVPVINYGQETGMTGKLANGRTDGNTIPVREAMDWYASGNGQGMANWYKDAGEWWTNRYAKANDGISVEEQMKDPNSLWSYYKSLIRIRKMQPAMVLGDYRTVPNTNEYVVSFVRTASEDKILVMINLSAQSQMATLDDDTLPLDVLKLLSGTANVTFPKGGRTLVLTPYAVQVWQIPAKRKPTVQE